MKIADFCGISSCDLIVDRYFGDAYCLHRQGDKALLKRR